MDEKPLSEEDAKLRAVGRWAVGYEYLGGTVIGPGRYDSKSAAELCIMIVDSRYGKKGMLVVVAELDGARRSEAKEPSEAVRSSALVSLAARWLEEAKNRRAAVESEKALGGRDDDATIGYCECLEDKAAELRKAAGSEANHVI